MALVQIRHHASEDKTAHTGAEDQSVLRTSAGKDQAPLVMENVSDPSGRNSALPSVASASCLHTSKSSEGLIL